MANDKCVWEHIKVCNRPVCFDCKNYINIISESGKHISDMYKHDIRQIKYKYREMLKK